MPGACTTVEWSAPRYYNHFPLGTGSSSAEASPLYTRETVVPQPSQQGT